MNGECIRPLSALTNNKQHAKTALHLMWTAWLLAMSTVPVMATELNTSTTTAAASAPASAPTALPQAIAATKQQAIALNRELFLLEQALLFPPETELGLYLSIDTGQFFQLDSVQLILNDEPIAAHLYTASQRDALLRGAIQPLYTGNIDAGDHQLTVVFVGKGPDQRDYRRAVDYRFTKTDKAVRLELQVRDRSENFQPEFVVQPWQQPK